MNFAIIGTFWLSENFINAIKKTDGTHYYAQYSRSLEKAREFSEKNGGAEVCYDSLYALAEDKNVDAVYISSPNMTHYAYSKLFIEAGKHVFCEKPITVTVEEYRELSSLADKKGVVYAEAMMNYHLPQTNALENKLREAGDVVSAHIDFSQRSSKLERVEKGEKISTFDKQSCGGALMDLGVYCVYLAVMLFGLPRKINASAHFWRDEVDIADSVILTYENFDAVLTFTKLAESRARSEIICRDGTFLIEQCAQMRGVSFTDKEGNNAPVAPTLSPVDCMACELSDFISYTLPENFEKYLEARKTAENVLVIMQRVRDIIGYDIHSVAFDR